MPNFFVGRRLAKWPDLTLFSLEWGLDGLLSRREIIFKYRDLPRKLASILISDASFLTNIIASLMHGAQPIIGVD